MNQYAHAVFVALLVGGLTVAGTAAPVVGASGGETGVTFVESDVTTDTTWTPGDGPYRVIQDIGVERGATLTVAPGTEVQFADGMTITVAGSMAVAGTESRPVTLETTPGASAAAQWGGLRYEGGTDSSLTLANTTIGDATNGLTVASEAGRVSLRDVTITEIGRHGIAVDDVSSMPETTVKRSTVAGVGGHGIAATPRAGTIDAISLDAADTERGKQTRHTLRMVTGVEATVDEIELGYGGHGNASGVDADAIEVFGLDHDDDADVDRTWTDRIENVTADEDGIRLTLADSVRLRGDDELVLSVSDVVNPETRGIYRVDVRLNDRSVSQLSGGVHAPLVVGDVRTDHADTTVVGTTSVEALSVRDSTFEGIEGAGLFVDADAVDVDLRNNRIGAVQGDGISIRAGSLAGTVRANDVTAGDAGIHLAVRDGVGRLRVVDNTVTESDAGLRIRQSGSRVRASVGATVDRNTFANNTGDGIDAKTDRGRLTDFSLAENVLRDNGGAGASLSHYAIGAGTIADNRVVGNGGDGIAIRTRSVTGTDLVANTLAENGGDGLDLRTATSVRDVAVRNATVRDNAGHGLAIATDLVVHEVTVDGGVFSNNAGAGLLVRSPLTHGGTLQITDTVVAANPYGIHLRGALRANLTGNEVVYNTNERVDPVSIDGVEPGTGISVVEGPHGVVVERGGSAVPLSDLVADPRVQAQLANVAPRPETAVVLRTDGDGHARLQAESALPIERALRDLPTGVALPTDGTGPGVSVNRNDVRGHPVGLTVAVEPLIDANTTARLLVDGMRTVTAEDTYWGAQSGPFHDSILPSGQGDAVETRAGWVDFVPFAETARGDDHARPVASVTAPETAVPGTTVTVSGEPSTAPTGSIERYHFVVNGTERSARAEPILSFTMPNESVTVELAVENQLGVESATTANATIEPARETTTSSTKPTTGGPPPTSTPSNERGLPGTILGLLGGGLYLAGLLAGSYGMWLTVKRQNPPFEGRTVHALALGGVGLWAVGGALVGDGLLGAAVAGGAAWAVLTGLAYLLASR